MRLKFNPATLSLLDLIRSELDEETDLFIVGGAVRDLLLGRNLQDLDFALPENPTSLAKRLAMRLNAGFFVLDDARHTARVVYRDEEGSYFPLDFVQFTGQNLEEDLKNRDFTINAMAISIDEITKIIDPLGGQADLADGIIRVCTVKSLLSDPVRVLRGIRLAMQFNFQFTEGLLQLMQSAAEYLPETSYERQRDELFKILEGPNPAMGIEYCLHCRVFETLIPPLALTNTPTKPASTKLDFSGYTIRMVEVYNHLLQVLCSEIDAQDQNDWCESHLLSELDTYSSDVQAYFQNEITPGRTVRGLALLGVLLQKSESIWEIALRDVLAAEYDSKVPFSAELAWSTAKKLQLSNAEAEWMRTMVDCYHQFTPLLNDKEGPSRKAVYLFFRDAGETGVAVTFVALADILVSSGDTLSQAQWVQAVKSAKEILTAWWQQRDTVVSPVSLLDGNDLQEIFGLTPGKQIGKLLNQLLEAQASGVVLSREDAEKFIATQLKT